MVHSDVKYTIGEILNYLSPYPINHPDYIPTDMNGLFCKAETDDKFELFTGTIQRFLNNNRTVYVQGKHQGTIWNCTREDGLIELKEKIKNKKVDMSKLYKELYGC